VIGPRLLSPHHASSFDQAVQAFQALGSVALRTAIARSLQMLEISWRGGLEGARHVASVAPEGRSS